MNSEGEKKKKKKKKKGGWLKKVSTSKYKDDRYIKGRSKVNRRLRGNGE